MEGEGRWEAEGGWQVKAPIWTQRAVPCLQVTIHKGGQDCRVEQFGTPCSPNNVPQDHEIHPRGLTASTKSHLKKQT